MGSKFDVVLARRKISYPLVDYIALRGVLDVAVRLAPLFTPRMPGTGAAFSVKCTNFGSLGWCSDKARGYHYSATHPLTETPWPPIPERLLELWREYVPSCEPECCLVNHYARGSKLGMHVDSDEDAFDVPVISVSLGASAKFRLGGWRRSDPSQVFDLNDGDVLVLGGESRRWFHGVDSVAGPRISLTLRRVTLPASKDRE